MTSTHEEVSIDRDVKHRVAAEIRSWLGRRRLSQEWLANTLGVGRTAIVKKLAGEQGFSLTQLVIIAESLDITLGQLLGDELVNEKNPHLVSGEGSRGQTLGHTVAGDGFEPSTSGL